MGNGETNPLEGGKENVLLSVGFTSLSFAFAKILLHKNFITLKK